MKFFSLLIFLLSLASCSHHEGPVEITLQDDKLLESPPFYMSRQEVLDEVKALSKRKATMDQPLDVRGLAREHNLIPDAEFLKGVPSPVKGFAKEEISKDAPLSVDLRHRDTPVKSQDNGKCTAYAGTAAIENTLQREKVIPGLDLSDWHSWSFYKQYSAVAFIKALSKNMVGNEVDFPQYGKAKASLRPYVKISKQTYLEDNIPSVVNALARGNVVYLAMKTPKSMLNCDRVISLNSKASSGGHALLISGYYMEGSKVVAILKNSWGKDCGDNGFQYLPLDLCHKKGFYCNFWEIEAVDRLVGVDPAPVPLPVPSPRKVCTRKWYSPWKVSCQDVSPVL